MQSIRLRLTILALLLALLSPLPLLAENTAENTTEAELGSIHFPTSAGAEAQAHFERGVLYLHSFEYRDAKEAFLRAQEAEANFAMAYWGEAMTYNHPIWLEENLDAGRQALAKLAPTAAERRAKAASEKEKEFLDTVEILFGEGDKRSRDDAYSAALAAMRQRYPEDLEATSFHALSLLGTCHDGRDTATYMRAAAVAEEAFAKNPRHPGAAHYLIHAYDDAVHAPLGLRAARVYAGIAPAAGHALHMPSHIFLALGMWAETAASNEASWQAVEDRVERENLPSSRRNYHALQWLQYAYLQQGRLREARNLLAIIAADAEKDDSPRTRHNLIRLRAAWLADTGRYQDLPPAPDLGDLPLSAAALGVFTEGWAALLRQEPAVAEQALGDLRQRIKNSGKESSAAAAHSCKLGTEVSTAKPKTAKAGYQRVGKEKDIGARVLALELDALIHRAGGERGQAVALLQRAAALQVGLPFGFGPPMPVKPVHELMAEILLEMQRPVEAVEQLRIALSRTPGRAAALKSMSQASRWAR